MCWGLGLRARVQPGDVAAECGEHVEHDVVGIGTEELLDEGRHRRVDHTRLVQGEAEAEGEGQGEGQGEG
jgi:hypothetical protein